MQNDFKRVQSMIEKTLKSMNSFFEPDREAEFTLRKDVKSLKDIRVAAIADTFTHNSFFPECTWMQVTPTGWLQELEEFKPDMFFLESAWRGKDNLWTGKIYGASPELCAIMDYCHRNGISVIYWGKEDPVHTDRFMNAARMCDFVFTTSVDVIPKYRKVLNHDRVYYLPFAAQPANQNPITTETRQHKVSFAGTWYYDFPERNELLWDYVQSLSTILDFDIYDRNFNIQNSRDKFPPKFTPYVRGTLPFEKINHAYKGYRYSVNMNSVTDGKGMFARRVFELMLSNTVVLSNNAVGMESLFGDLVIHSDSGEEIAKRVEELERSGDYRHIRLRSLRRVLKEHLYEYRFSTIVNVVFGFKRESTLPKIYIYSDGDHTDFDTQTYRNTEQRLFGDSLPDDDDAFVTVFDKNCSYGENYLTDLALSVKYCDRLGFTKPEIAWKSYTYCNNMELKKGIAAARLLKQGKEKISPETTLTGDFLQIDEFNFADKSKGQKLIQDKSFGFEGSELGSVLELDETKEEIFNLTIEDFKGKNTKTSKGLFMQSTDSSIMLMSDDQSKSGKLEIKSLLYEEQLCKLNTIEIELDAEGCKDTKVQFAYNREKDTANRFVILDENGRGRVEVPNGSLSLDVSFFFKGGEIVFIKSLKIFKISSQITPGVSVIIPTYKPTDTLKEAVESVENQEYPADKLEIIIVVNGKNYDYYRKLLKEYKNAPMVKVKYTEKGCVSAGRNVGMYAAAKTHLMFLDDDDWFTPRYIRTLADGITDNVYIAVGRLINYSTDDNSYNDNTYVNTVLRESPVVTSDYFDYDSVLANFPEKLFDKKMFIQQFGGFNEGDSHTEDVLFWCHNFDNIIGDVFLCSRDSKEAYVRRLVIGSRSRPDNESLYSFWITERLSIICNLAEIITNGNYTLKHKRCVLNKLQTQQNMMLDFFNKLTPADKERARKEIFETDCLFLNKSRFSSRKAIAFLHNFSPFVDAAAYRGTKRLEQIDKLENGPLDWHVISKDMSNVRNKDFHFNTFYAKFHYDTYNTIGGNAKWSEKGQWEFGMEAFRRSNDINAEVIYSSVLWLGSHVAAYYYKKTHPNAIWYAEFSDPILYGTDDKPRKSAQYEGDDACLNNLWRDVEQMAYELADHIIFTNENQKKYMMSYNPFPERNERIEEHSLVMHHPILPKEYSNIASSSYKLDESKINVAFFGTFYANRTHDDMLNLLKNDDVVLHIFTTHPEKLKKGLKAYGKRIRVNSTTNHLGMLNLCTKMDYLYLNDVDFEGEINPYLPSKYADYCVSGTPIIAKVRSGSVLSKEDNKNLIQATEITEELALSLKKKTAEKDAEVIINNCDTMILSTHYPSKDNLYRHMFIHSRVKHYVAEGKSVNVFLYRREDEKVSQYSFEGVDVTIVDKKRFDESLRETKTVCIHFVDRNMWDVLKNHLDHIRIIIWCHGFEIQPWYRREFNCYSDMELEREKKNSAERMELWKEIFNAMEKHEIHLVFVSQYFADEVMEDHKVRIPEDKYTIIHNFIDTELFTYEKKDVSQRLKLLSIRPYASRKYANDLTVEMIKLLSDKPFFKELEFKLVGNGVLFEEIFNEVKDFDNVSMDRGFLTRDEIASLHKQYGVFMSPIRMDAQGVSRDEAMSSGLVPVTNSVTAIPEFCDDSCAILAPAEDAQAMADGVERLYKDKKLFSKLSENAAKRVRGQSSYEYTVKKEIELIWKEKGE